MSEFALPDTSRCHLDDGCVLAWCVAADGERWPWIIVPGGDRLPAGCWRPCCAPHEQDGWLPTRYRDRCELRCGRPRTDGRPCRMPVRRLGDACHHHRGLA